MTKQYCDICGKEVMHTNVRRLCISANSYWKNQKDFDICDDCEEKLVKLQNDTEINFVKKSKWWEENSNETGEINYGSFKLSGTFEQGGYICPKCGYCNNAYSFEHICQKCGYTTK